MPRRAALLLLLAALGGLGSAVPRDDAERDPYSRLLASTVWVNAAHHGKGTGWVVDRGKRWVVTCYHVVGEGDAVEVFFPWRVGGRVVSARREYLTHAPELRNRGLIVRAKVLRRNPQTDLALLELASMPAGTEALPLAPASSPPGATAHLVGNRYDVEVLWTYATGDVRFAQTLREGYFSGGKRLAKGAAALTASVPINEGDSGGPLVDDAGRLIGVAAAVAWEAHGAGLFIDVRHVRELLGEPAPPPDTRLDAAGVYGRSVEGVVLVQYAGGPRAAGVVIDRARRLIVTTATAVSRDDALVLTFPHRQGGALVSGAAWYRSQDALLRRRGGRCTGVVLATDARRNLALVEAKSMPPSATEMTLATVPSKPGDRLHLISHPLRLEVLWAYASTHLRQTDAVNLGQDADGPSPAVLVLQAPLGDREAGGPVLDGRGNLVGLLSGKIGPQQQVGFAVTAGEVRAFLDEQRPLAHPASPSERLRRAEVFARAHAWRRALEEYDAANSFAGRAWAHYQLGDDAGAIRDATKAVALDPKDGWARVARAASLAHVGKTSDALRDAEEAVKLDPKSALAFAVRAMVRLGAGRIAEAVADADEAVWLDAKLGLAYRVRGEAQARRGEVDQALADLGRAIASDPRDAVALLARAALHLRKDDPDSALADYEQALKLDPRDGVALHGRARCRLAKGQYDAGLLDLDRAIWLAPARLVPYVDRGGQHVRRGEYRLAVADFARAGPTLGREVLAELERRAEAHLGDDPARAADLYRDTLKALLASVKPVSLRRRVEREMTTADGAADRRAAFRSLARLLRDEWQE